jgi:hypothetical protein
MYWHSKIHLKLLPYYKVSREFTFFTLIKKLISCNPFSVRKEGKVYSVVKTIYHKIIKYTVISLGERERERDSERESHTTFLCEKLADSKETVERLVYDKTDRGCYLAVI